MEELNQMVIEHAMEKTALKLLKMNLSMEQISSATSLSEEKVLELQRELELEMA